MKSDPARSTVSTSTSCGGSVSTGGAAGILTAGGVGIGAARVPALAARAATPPTAVPLRNPRRFKRFLSELIMCSYLQISVILYPIWSPHASVHIRRQCPRDLFQRDLSRRTPG